ncbi:hypothetical protein [Kitasatospora sp. NPDC004289]
MGLIYVVVVVVAVAIAGAYFLAPAYVAGLLAVVLTRRLPWYLRVLAMLVLPALSALLCRPLVEGLGVARTMIVTVIVGLLVSLAALQWEDRRRARRPQEVARPAVR